METLEVRKVDRGIVAQALERAGVVDPRHVNTPADIASGGDCFTFTTPAGTCAFVVRKVGGVWWIDGAASMEGTGLTPVGLLLAECAARQAGCERVAFETNRPGLVKLAKRAGYRITGFIMEKALP